MTYVYDGLGERVNKAVAGGITTTYLHAIRQPGGKYSEGLALWQARVSRLRFYFTIEGEVYQLHEIIKHPK